MQDRSVLRELELLVVALVVLLEDGALGVIAEGSGEQLRILGLILQLLNLDASEFQVEGRQRPQLEIQIAQVAPGHQKARNGVVALDDLELLKIPELHKAGHVRTEMIADPIIPAGNRAVIALQLDVPGFSVRLCGGEQIPPVHKLRRTRYLVPLKLGGEHIVRGAGHRPVAHSSGQGVIINAVENRRLGRDRCGYRFFRRRFRRPGSLSAGREQERCQQQRDQTQFSVFHLRNLLRSSCCLSGKPAGLPLPHASA